MKKTFKFFAAALAIVAAASCAKEISNDNIPVEDAEKLQVTVTASYDVEGDTKAILAADKKVHWSDDDAIVIYRYNSDSEIQSCSTLNIDPSSNDNDPTFAVFTGELIYKKGHYYYAAYPGEGWSADYMRFDLGLARQNAVKGSFDPKKYLALADGVKNDSYDHYVFHNACALLKVTVGSDNVYSVKVEGKYAPNEYSEYGIGQQIRFSAGTLSVTSMQESYKAANDITLSNENGSSLENGTAYYIVVPHVTVKNFKVSLCDANGNALVTKSKASDFNIERNKVYDLGTLEVPNESIEVSSTSISLAATNASASFKVIANADWTVSSSASWLTVSPSSGAATSSSGTTVTVTAAENTSTQNRTATITIKGAFVTKTISVTQEKCKTYKSVKQLTHATELEDGKLYVISYMKDSKYFWTENGQWIELAYFSSSYVSDNQFTANQVFKFHKVNTSASIGSYNTTVVGMWQSMSNNNYMSSTPAMNGTSNDASYVAIGQWNGWEKDFDMYIGTSSDNTLYYNGSRVAKGSIGTAESNNRGQQARKWYIYEVTER